MAREIIYLVQPLAAGKAARLNAGPPIHCASPESARKRVENLVMTKAGVVAFATSGDSESGEYDERPAIIFEAGQSFAARDAINGFVVHSFSCRHGS